VFNGTSTQEGKFVPIAGDGNPFRQLWKANEIQCIIPYVHDYNVTLVIFPCTGFRVTAFRSEEHV